MIWRPFYWLADRPKLLLTLGCICAITSFIASVYCGQWHWFQRGGTLTGVAGLVVSLRQALLFRPHRPPEFQSSAVGFEGLFRTGPSGAPMFCPHGPSIPLFPDPETIEESEAEREKAIQTWEEADDDELTLVRKADIGRTIEMTDDELLLMRSGAIMGIFGTIIAAFGDLFGFLLH